MMTLNEHLRALYDIVADQILAELEPAMIEAAAAGVARPVALAANFAPLEEAIGKIRSKTPVASAMRTAQWADVPIQIRNRAQFSAGVESARVMQDIQRKLEADLGWKPGVAKGREAFIRDVRATLEEEGYKTNPKGALTDISSNRRLGLIYDMQTRDARNFAKWKMDQDPDLLGAAPALELIRERQSKVPRPWAERFVRAGGTLYGQRMIAHKLSPVWQRLSRFGNPWPPFDFNSGMGVEDVTAAEAKKLGVETPDPDEAVTERAYNEGAEAEIEELSEEKIGWIKERLGDQVSMQDGKLRLSPLSWRTPEEAEEWVAEAYPDVQETPEEKLALVRWSPNRPAIEVQAVDAVIERSEAKESGVAFLVQTLGEVAAGALLVKGASHLRVSLSEQEAWKKDLTRRRGGAEVGIVKVHLPKGTKGVYLGGDDAGFLLQRGTAVRQVSDATMEIDGKVTRIVTAMIEQAEAGAR